MEAVSANLTGSRGPKTDLSEAVRAAIVSLHLAGHS